MEKPSQQPLSRDLVDGGLVEVVEHDPLGGEPGLPHDVQRAAGPARLVAVRGVDEGGQAVVGGELELARRGPSSSAGVMES